MRQGDRRTYHDHEEFARKLIPSDLCLFKIDYESYLLPGSPIFTHLLFIPSSSFSKDFLNL